MNNYSNAQNLASYGREGDSQLIHVSPNELQGLQALAQANGTTLTINPNTGLPEAFNFKKLIPMAAGAALAATGVGAPAAALMVGGGYGLATGSVKQGIMAGIGAYGGAGIAGGLMGAGAATAEGAAAGQLLQQKAGEKVVEEATVNALAEGVPLADNFAEMAVSQVTPAQVAAQQTTTGNLANMGRGVSQLGSTAGIKAAYTAMPFGTLPATATSLLVQDESSSSVPGYQEDEYDKRLKRYKLSPDFQSPNPVQPNPYYRPTYAAEGGVMNSYDDSSGMDQPAGLDQGNLQKGLFGLGFAAGGLGGYSDGGRMLKGPGDGMSDSIPGIIGGKQPARLADGEFVVPADVVSHLGNGSTDGGAKKLYDMMDRIRQARTGKKKQAPEVNADKYLPVKKAGGGITGYASGGIMRYAEGGVADAKDISRVYEQYLGRIPSADEVSSWQNTKASFSTISQGIRKSEEGKAFSSNKDNAEKIVTSLYLDQLGREPDAEGLKFWSSSLASGTPLDEISQGINQSLEGQNFDTQFITSLYRQNLARNPEQAGFQYWLSEAQAAGYTPKEIESILKQAATPEQAVRKIDPGEKATEMQLNALEADPAAGRYLTRSIYDLLPDAVNVSSIGGKKAQFVAPVTQQRYVSNYGKDGSEFTQALGQEVLNDPQVQASITVARNNGSLSTAGYNALLVDLGAAKTPEQVRAALAKPQAQVIIDAIQGQQIGENADLSAAKAEAAKRQAVLTAQDPGYYQSNRVLTDAYEKAGVTIPFDYGAYRDVDTRTGEANLFTPENFQEKQANLIKELTTYKPTYPTLNRRTTDLPASVRDPYSDEGLKFLYGQMMDQYGPPPEGFINPASFKPTPYTYKPPISPARQAEADAKAAYDAKVAADRLAYPTSPITQSNFDAAAYLRDNPDVAAAGRDPFAHYQEFGRNEPGRVVTRLPFTPAPFVAAPLFGPTAQASAPVGSTVVAADASTPAKAGGLMSINRKKIAKNNVGLKSLKNRT